MKMLSWGDDYPLHQTPEPVAYSGSDRNFYDRYFFNGYSPDGSVFFAVAFGVYPHLNIMDGAVSILKDGVQTSLHLSRILNMERMDTRVGPLSVEVLEPLARLRVRLEETDGLALDVVFTGRAFPIEEPRFSYRQGPRMLIDCTRMTQNGHWQGQFRLDGQTVEIGKGWAGTRDRSWGVRPIGSQDAQPLVPPRLPQYYWLWSPTNFADQSLFFHVNDDAKGGTWNTRAVLARDGVGTDEFDHLNAPRMVPSFRQGTRRASAAVLTFADVRGATHTVRYTPLSTFQMKGIGYGHPEWGHGAFKGAFAKAREDFRPDDLNPMEVQNLHVQAICSARHEGPDGKMADGIGILEQLIIGPHAPSGFADIIDGAR
jgi:hypothetical protein